MSITELILQAKAWEKDPIRKGLLFRKLCVPIEQWMRYQPNSFFYGFPNVSSVTIHSFRLLFWKMSLNVNIASVVSWRLSECFVRKRQMRPLFLSFLLRSHLSRLIYYWIDIWKTDYKKIDYKQRLSCFCRYYGANLEYFSAFSWLQFPVDFSAKREEQTTLFCLQK